RHFDPLCGSCRKFVAILLLKGLEYQSKKVSIKELRKQTEFLHRKVALYATVFPKIQKDTNATRKTKAVNPHMALP
ncbi:MAG: hypothetical protein K2O61_04605, partial [Bacteroidaceae bacterium]|nr:hypothetical protein [Bacteroidaceae bacterium]